MKSPSRTFLIFAVIALAVAILRYYMRSWTDPLGWPPIIGSLLASITVVVFIALLVIFIREGRAPAGRYLRAGAWFLLLTAWCQALIIAGILITQQTGASTYYNEAPFERMRFPSATRHALAHVATFLPVAAVELLIGAFVYWLAKRYRRTQPAAAGQNEVAASLP